QVLQLMERFLARKGLRIVTAGNGTEGLRLAREKPAAIILDVTIPDMTGWEVLTALKEDPEVAPVPVIMFTRAEGDQMGVQLPGTDYLTKPIDWQRLSELLGRLQGKKPGSRLLVIDDDPDCRALVSRSAGQKGWEVREAANGWVALKSVVEAPPDL